MKKQTLPYDGGNMNEEAIRIVMDYYRVDREDALEYYKDEIEAHQHLRELRLKALDELANESQRMGLYD